jgi:hypothetical protein
MKPHLASLGNSGTVLKDFNPMEVGNLQSYWTTTKLWKLTVVLDYYDAMETYSRIGLLRAMETYSRIGLLRS